MTAIDTSGVDDAFCRGIGLFRTGANYDACLWLERAARISDGDETVVLALAAAQQRIDPRLAATTLTGLVTAAPDTMAGWLALAAALLSAGDWIGAARTCGQMLTRFTVPATPSIRSLLDKVVRHAGQPGWVDVDVNGRITAVLAEPGNALPTVTIDGTPVIWKEDQSGRSVLRARVPLRCRPGFTLTATLGDRPLLGSGLDLRRRFNPVGLLDWSASDEVIAWAWLPASIARPPRLIAQADGGPPVRLVGPEFGRTGRHLLSHPREAWRFAVPDTLIRSCSSLVIRGRNSGELWGSPIYPGSEARSRRQAARQVVSKSLNATPLSPEPDEWSKLPVGGRPKPSPEPAILTEGPLRCCVVIPVLDQLDDVERCLNSVLRSSPDWAEIIIVDDGSSEPGIIDLLAGLTRQGRVTVLRNQVPQGFPRAANAGLRVASKPGQCDVVLLNSDTVVAPGWLDRLRRCAYRSGDIGSVTPLSCDGSIVSHPDPDRLGDMRQLSTVQDVDERLEQLNAGMAIDLPSGVGFCLFITAACLSQTGLLREKPFSQGYGEENDWCMRARALRWRHVAAADVFVAHLGGRSFGLGRDYLLRRNAAVLERLHPGYADFVADCGHGPVIRRAWRRFEEAALRAGSVPGRTVLLVSHGQGGGTERYVRSRISAFATMGMRVLVLRSTAEAKPDSCVLTLNSDGEGMEYDVPLEAEDLASLLLDCSIRSVEVHHLLGHSEGMVQLIKSLCVPYYMYIHDYFFWCPRLHLTSYANVYCGEPDQVQVCDTCVRDLGSAVHECRSVDDYRRKNGELLEGAAGCYVASADVRLRLSRQFPKVRTDILPWESARPACTHKTLATTQNCKVLVVGAIGLEKGYELLLSCARDAVTRNLPMIFHVIGFTMDDARLMETNRVFITGRYREEELPGLLERAAGDIGFVTSVWPETWCFALSELMTAGLPVATLDIGTQAERVSRSPHGLVLPRTLPAPAVNNALLRHVSRLGSQSASTGKFEAAT